MVCSHTVTDHRVAISSQRSIRRQRTTRCRSELGPQLGMTRLQPYPYHPNKDLEAEVALKKTSPAW